MMVSIMSNFFKIIVLTADSNTFLSIGCAFIFPCTCSKKNIFKLVHSCICKKQSWIIERNNRRTGYYSMLFILKKL